MTLWQNFKKTAIVFLTGGCVTYTPPSNYVYQEISAPPFILASWQKIGALGAPLTIYIEGDGNSFNAQGQATKDPTPRQTTLRDMAFRDNDANVAYLARPCQFVLTKNCDKKYWTDARFASEVIEAEAKAVRVIMEQSNSTETVLVGYSGGATVAGLIAVQNRDIKVRKLITIAGLLNHKEWTAYHHVPPLAKSLDLNDCQKELSEIPQIHFKGEKDKIIPLELKPSGGQIIVVPDAGHNRGWDSLDLKNYK